jgi:hypothetical protein
MSVLDSGYFLKRLYQRGERTNGTRRVFDQPDGQRPSTLSEHL